MQELSNIRDMKPEQLPSGHPLPLGAIEGDIPESNIAQLFQSLKQIAPLFPWRQANAVEKTCRHSAKEHDLRNSE